MLEEKYGRLYLDDEPYHPREIHGFFMSNGTKIDVILLNPEWHKKPHFHLCSEDNSIKCAIGIYEPIYVSHKKYKSRLTEENIKDLIDWLTITETYVLSNTVVISNWKRLRVFWNAAEGNRIQPEKGHIGDDVPFPDYMKLLEY